MNLDQIKERYSEPHRFYHNFKHIQYMLKTGEENGINFEDEYKNENLLHLIYCHDVIYIPGNLDNEELSGKFAVEFYEQLCSEYEKEHNPPDNPFQELISFDYTPHTLYPIVINFTKNHIINYEELFKEFNYPEEIQHWKYTAENLIDLDLAILGDTWEVYQEYASNVRKEYAHATDEQWKAGRGKWLSDMIGRKSIYYTDWGKKREDQAMKNMMKELNDFGFIDFSLLLVK